MTAVVAGLLLGAVGSVHCALMCGPIAALTRRRGFAPLYHAGRFVSYIGLGLVAGALGQFAAGVGLGRVLAIGSGTWLIVMAVARQRRPRVQWVNAGFGSLIGRASHWLRREGHSATLMLGALNGLLPCGLVYAAVLAAVGFGRLDQGVLFLLAFGAGTVPLLAAAGASIAVATRRTRTLGQHGTPIVLGLIGALLLVRGLAWPHAHAAPADTPMTNEVHRHLE